MGLQIKVDKLSTLILLMSGFTLAMNFAKISVELYIVKEDFKFLSVLPFTSVLIYKKYVFIVGQQMAPLSLQIIP